MMCEGPREGGVVVVGAPFLEVVGDVVAARIGAGVFEVDHYDAMVERSRFRRLARLRLLERTDSGLWEPAAEAILSRLAPFDKRRGMPAGMDGVSAGIALASRDPLPVWVAGGAVEAL